MRIYYLLFLLLRFIHPLPAEEIPEPVWEPIPYVMEEAQPEMVYMYQDSTGEFIVLEEGMDGTDVNMSDLY